MERQEVQQDIDFDFMNGFKENLKRQKIHQKILQGKKMSIKIQFHMNVHNMLSSLVVIKLFLKIPNFLEIVYLKC